VFTRRGFLKWSEIREPSRMQLSRPSTKFLPQCHTLGITTDAVDKLNEGLGVISYLVSIRGPVPPDLGRKLSQAHALAIQKKPTSAANAPVGQGSIPDATGQPH
jgi:hypothetical protein